MRWILLTAVVFVMGCPPRVSTPLGDPEEGRAAWVTALKSGDRGRIWSMLAPDAQSGFADQAAFSAWCERYCAELLVMELSRDGKPEQVIQVGAVSMTREGQRWAVTAGPGLAAATPKAALSAYRARLASELGAPGLSRSHHTRTRRVVAAIDRALASGVAEPEGGARELTIPLDGALRAVLLKEDGAWRLDRVFNAPSG